jgi:hypothetical protein
MSLFSIFNEFVVLIGKKNNKFPSTFGEFSVLDSIEQAIKNIDSKTTERWSYSSVAAPNHFCDRPNHTDYYLYDRPSHNDDSGRDRHHRARRDHDGLPGCVPIPGVAVPVADHPNGDRDRADEHHDHLAATTDSGYYFVATRGHRYLDQIEMNWIVPPPSDFHLAGGLVLVAAILADDDGLDQIVA